MRPHAPLCRLLSSSRTPPTAEATAAPLPTLCPAASASPAATDPAAADRRGDRGATAIALPGGFGVTGRHERGQTGCKTTAHQVAAFDHLILLEHESSIARLSY